jgi:putative NIF3 family GTP cyclohydrolase 1 type 2
VASLDEIIAFCDELLDSGSFDDYGPNGLQVPGVDEVHKVATGVSANLELLDTAIESGAQLVLTHHGLLWGSKVTPLSTPMAARLRALLCADVSLAAYHLETTRSYVMRSDWRRKSAPSARRWDPPSA